MRHLVHEDSHELEGLDHGCLPEKSVNDEVTPKATHVDDLGRVAACPKGPVRSHFAPSSYWQLKDVIQPD